MQLLDGSSQGIEKKSNFTSCESRFLLAKTGWLSWKPVQPMILKKKVKKVQDANDQSFGTMAVEEVALDILMNGRPVIGVLVKNDN